MKNFNSNSFINELAVNSRKGVLANRFLNIQLNDAAPRSLTLKIYDVVGRILFEKQTGFLSEKNAELDISDFSLGMYFLQLENNQGKVQTERFVINS